MSRHNFLRLSEYILNLIFPQKCIFCGTLFDIVPQIAICDDCRKELRFVDQQKLLLHMRDLKPQYFDHVVVSCEYVDAMKEALIRYKFHDKPFYFRALGRLLADTISGLGFDVITCVPLHKTREADRGYNQSALIAKALGKKVGLPVDVGILSRIKSTQSQSLLNRSARVVNIKGAFIVAKPDRVLGRSILLIDDILTTGLTLNECSRVLKEAGAKSITIAAVASGATVSSSN